MHPGDRGPIPRRSTNKMFIWEVILFTVLASFIAWFFYRNFSKPSHNREWIRVHKKLPSFEYNIEGKVIARNIRSARYRTESDYDVSYKDGVFDINNLSRVWFIIEPYSFGQAHTFLSFEFDDERYLGVSVEVRKTRQKSFKAWMVSIWNYEIFYILADEEDLLYLRTNIRKDPVRLYPLRLSREAAQEVFKSVISGVNNFYENPVFYRIFSLNCTNIPMSHIRQASSLMPRFNAGYVITSGSDRVLYQAGLIDNSAPLSVIRRRYNITSKAQSLKCDASFSKRVRSR